MSQTAEMSNQDLEKLSKALDGCVRQLLCLARRLAPSLTLEVTCRAIMRFHGLKMKEINDTIADLWTKTYQGTGASRSLPLALSPDPAHVFCRSQTSTRS